MHGLALAFDKMRLSLISNFKFQISNFKVVQVLGVVITFHFVCFCWIFFKASSFHDAGIIISQIVNNFDAAAFIPLLSAYGTVFSVMLLGYIIHFIPKSYQYFSEKILVKVSLVGRIAILLIFIWLVIQVKQADQVMPIYLQF